MPSRIYQPLVECIDDSFSESVSVKDDVYEPLLGSMYGTSSDSASSVMTLKPLVSGVRRLGCGMPFGVLKRAVDTQLSNCLKIPLPGLSGWGQTVQDLKAVRQLRKKLTFEGYPFSRLIKNQIGDGILNSSIAGMAVAAASADPLSAGILVWGTRAVEYCIAVIWNQRASSDRRLARLAAEGSIAENKLECKWKAARELVSSCKYDLISGLATAAGLATAMLGGPVGVIIGMAGLIAVSQTLSRFKEMSWGALRYIVNPNESLQKEMVDLQEPMSAYEMVLNIGAMTLSYIVCFASITAFYVFLPEVALPVSIALGLFGLGMMLKAKYQFKQEERQAKQALELEKIWQASFAELKRDYDSYVEKIPRHNQSVSGSQIESLRKAAEILKGNVQDSGFPNTSEIAKDLDNYIHQIERSSSQELQQYFDIKENNKFVSLKGWSMHDLAELFRSDTSDNPITPESIRKWLSEQALINKELRTF